MKMDRESRVGLGLALGGYVVVLALCMTFVNLYPGSVWRLPVALLPVAPLLFGLRTFVRYLRRLDELQRRIQFEALGFAFAATAFLTFGYGLLQMAGLPTVGWVWVWPVMFALWGIGGAVAGRRYR